DVRRSPRPRPRAHARRRAGDARDRPRQGGRIVSTSARPTILVVLGHPRGDSLCGALADSYADGARVAGADVTVLRLGDTDFDLASRERSLQRWLGADQDPAREPEVERMIAAVHAADHLVLVFPQWWGTYPALLKGWVDRVFLSQSAFAYREGSALWD